MYIVLGGDGKEYGPASLEQIREWVQQNRLDAESMLKRQGEADWKKLSEFPELQVTPPPAPSVTTAAPVRPAVIAPSGNLETEVSGSSFVVENYEVNLEKILAQTWELYKKNFWPCVGASVIVNVIFFAITVVPAIAGGLLGGMLGSEVGFASGIMSNLISKIAMMILMGPICAGFFYFYLKFIRGEQPTIGDVFIGFSLDHVVQLVLCSVVMSLLITAGFICCILPGIYLAVSYIFAFPLVFDKKLSFWEALETSRRTVSKKWLMVFLLFLTASLIGMIGLVGCIIGVIFTSAFTPIAIAYAYEDIYGKRNA